MFLDDNFLGAHAYIKLKKSICVPKKQEEGIFEKKRKTITHIVMTTLSNKMHNT